MAHATSERILDEAVRQAEEFGVPFYSKRGGRLQLTDAGRLLLPFAPWLFIGSGPLGAANLEAVARRG